MSRPRLLVLGAITGDYQGDKAAAEAGVARLAAAGYLGAASLFDFFADGFDRTDDELAEFLAGKIGGFDAVALLGGAGNCPVVSGLLGLPPAAGVIRKTVPAWLTLARHDDFRARLMHPAGSGREV